MSVLCRLLILFLLVQLTYTEETTRYHDGWIPISNEKVIGILPKNLIKIPEKVHFTSSWKPIVQTAENIRHFEENSNIRPHDINSELMNEGYYDLIQIDDIQSLRRLMIAEKQAINKNEDYSTILKDKNVNESAVARPRKAKKMPDEHLDNSMIHNDEHQRDSVKRNNDEMKYQDKEIVSDESYTYEVTETSETSDVTDSLGDNRNLNEIIINKDNKRFNFGPSFKSTTEESLTNKLFNILGNYNIRTNDDLTNYAISRNKYGLNYPKKGYVYPVPIRAPSRYNSPNYFPIDPLLAVLLSNYGYYVPGLYGFPGNYLNIYGYLAANNIHNNKPFGAYKIYSDTDSSH